MRHLTAFLLIAAPILGFNTTATADLADFAADVQVAVSAGGASLEGAVVKLDLNNNGLWDEGLGEPQAVTDVDGVADFGQIVSIQDPGGDDPNGVIDWQPSRIMMGNVRGSVGASDVQVDFALPSGSSTAGLGLYDLRGRSLAQTHGPGDLALNLPSALPSGVYFLRLSAGPAAPVSQRITSAGVRTQTIRANKLSAAEAVAAGWVEPRTLAGKQRSRDLAHPINILVSHVEYGGMNQAATITPEQHHVFSVAIPDSPDGFIHIPAGRFVMGSPADEPGRYSNENPQHQVTLTQGFSMSKYEVTEEFWAEVMNETPTTSQLPVNYVSWDMAVQFCNALSVREGLTPVYEIHGSNGHATWNQTANGYRLPTEAEWEYACRAGSTTALANGPLAGSIECIPICSHLDAMGWYCGNNSSWRQLVGQKQPNAWGLYDMHGNVYEWVWCGLRTYTSSSQVDPVLNVGPGGQRVYAHGLPG